MRQPIVPPVPLGIFRCFLPTLVSGKRVSLMSDGTQPMVPLRILIVDADALIAMFLAELLEGMVLR